jgi:hypothetical protein
VKKAAGVLLSQFFATNQYYVGMKYLGWSCLTGRRDKICWDCPWALTSCKLYIGDLNNIEKPGW